MKLMKIIALMSSLALVLSGCTPNPLQTDPEPIPMLGVTGEDLSEAYKLNDMIPYDRWMFESCEKLFAYQTNERMDESGQLTALKQGEGLEKLRNVGLKRLKKLAEFLPEISKYVEGVANEISAPDSKDENFLSFVKFCERYKVVQANFVENYLPPTEVHAGCYNTWKVHAYLLENLNGSGYWGDLGDKSKLSKSPWCTDKYPYGAKFLVKRYKNDQERILKVSYVSWSTFNNGARYAMSSETPLLPETGILTIDSGW